VNSAMNPETAPSTLVPKLIMWKRKEMMTEMMT